MSTAVLDLQSKPPAYFAGTRTDMLRYIPDSAERTLEIGCGEGAFSACLKDQRRVEAWAVDIEERAAQIAAERLDHVLCDEAHAAMDRLPNEYFDCVILFDILEHLVDPYSLLSTIQRKLRGRGVVVASIPNIRYYRVFWDFVVRGNWDYRDQGIMDKTHLRFFTHKSIRKMFERLEYELTRLEGIHPTSSRTFHILNGLLLNRTWDVRYKHFVAIARRRTVQD